MLPHPTPTDPEVAAITFHNHLDELWATNRPTQAGWGRIDLDPLNSIIALPGTREGNARDLYFLLLGAKYHDLYPPTVSFVRPDDWEIARIGTRWFPELIQRPPWFGLHDAYNYPDGKSRQLVCFSFTAEYYMTNHSPSESAVWKQGRHTVAATLYRLAEVLAKPFYKGPSG